MLSYMYMCQVTTGSFERQDGSKEKTKTKGLMLSKFILLDFPRKFFTKTFSNILVTLYIYDKEIYLL